VRPAWGLPCAAPWTGDFLTEAAAGARGGAAARQGSCNLTASDEKRERFQAVDRRLEGSAEADVRLRLKGSTNVSHLHAAKAAE